MRGIYYLCMDMGNVIEIDSLEEPGVRVYGSLTEAQLRQGFETGEGVFIAESPKVIRVALEAGYRPLSFLCERKHIEGDAADILSAWPDTPVYTGSRELLSRLTGYTLTRGVLCAMRRPEPRPLSELTRSGRLRLGVLHGVCDTTNIGAIFRSAAALGIDGMVLSGDCCDPLNRRAVRVSMGTVFLIPYAWSENPVKELRELGVATAAMALRSDSVRLDDPRLQAEERLALVMGTEGDGLPERVIEACDYTVMIPMERGVDSLNVGVAAGIGFYSLTRNH